MQGPITNGIDAVHPVPNGSNTSQRAAFKGPAVMIECAGALFDMDGTIIDSTQAIIKHWQQLGAILGVDPDQILATSHGRRSIDVLRLYDPSLANWEYINRIEGQIPKKFGQDAVEVPGSRALLDALEAARAPWTIVTSGTRPLVTGWLDVMKLAHPSTLVVADDVAHGKPDPACYLLGRERLGLDAQAKMVVFEDAPAGVAAGKAAGFFVIGLATTHSVQQIRAAGADRIVEDMRSVRLVEWNGRRMVLQVSNTLED